MPDSQPNPPARGMKIAMIAAAALAVAGLGTFYAATRQNQQATQGQTSDRTVSISATACEPNEITVPGGRRSFEIVNNSDRPIEWEILNGVLVVAERENIAPGFRVTLAAQLQPGEYQMTCGLLSNPRGTLTVTASDEAAAEASEVTLRKFLGPLSEYRVYLILQGKAALTAAEALQGAIASGNLDEARAAWIAARLPYRRIEPLAYRISDIENSIDPRAAYLEGREADPAFIGYHRIEYGLFDQNSLEGLAPVADRLVADLTLLQDRLKAMPLDPALLASLPGDMATQIAEGQIPQGENAYALNDLHELEASLDGIRKLTDLLRGVLAPVDPALEQEIGKDLDDLRAQLAGLKGPEGYPPYDQISDAQKTALTEGLTRLSAALGRMQPLIGMN